LLVGMLTPAMRATVNHSFCRPRVTRPAVMPHEAGRKR
jgi:hypothetical protein